MRKLFRSKATFLLAVILLVTVTVGATFAFIVAVTEPLRNLFVDANVSCATTYDEENKTWTITNDGDVEAYIRVSVVPYLTNGSDKVFWDTPDYTVEYDDGSKWTVIGDHGYHYYKIPLPAGDSIVFGTVNVDTDASDGFDYTVTKVTVNAEAFQVGSDEALADAWNVTYTEGVGFAAVSECSHSRSIVNVGGEYHKDYCTKCGIVYGFARHSLQNGVNEGTTHSGSCACGHEFASQPHTVAYTYIDGVTHTEFCTLCDWTQTVTCTYDTKPLLDVWGEPTIHCNVCACGAGAESEEHTLTYVDNEDGTHKRWCATCEYVKSTTVHTTVQDVEATTADTHTYTCSAGCGYSATSAHDWQRKFTAEGHWDVCLTCGYETARADHDLSVFTDDQNGRPHTVKCSACDYSEPATHNLVGTSVSDTEHTATCSDGCGYSETLVHNYTYEANGDGLTHTVRCGLPGCTHENESELHDWEYDTLEIVMFSARSNVNAEYHLARCKQCEYETEMEHSFTYSKIDDGSHTVACEQCTYSTNETHDMSSYAVNDGMYHTVECKNCEHYVEQTHDITYVINSTNHTAKCDDCGYIGTETAHTLSYTYDSANHTVTCTDGCGYSSTVAHTITYDSTDTTHTSKCDICSYVGATNDHTKGYSNPTAEGHTWTCGVCHESGIEGHTLVNGTCTLCGYQDTYIYEKQFADLNVNMQPLLSHNDGYVSNETVMFLTFKDGMEKQLMYPATRILSVTSYDGAITYEYGVDYTLENGNLVLLNGTRIRCISEGTYYAGNGMVSDGVHNLYWGEADTMTHWQVNVTYLTDTAYSGTHPTSYYNNMYRSFIEKLQKGWDVTVFFYGDSITHGANASFVINKDNGVSFAQTQGSYAMLFVEALADLFDYTVEYVDPALTCHTIGPIPDQSYVGGTRGTITYINTAVGGWTSADGYAYYDQHVRRYIKEYGCDLMVLAFGMNDIHHDPTNGTAANMRAIANFVVEDTLNDAEIVFVSTMSPTNVGDGRWYGNQQYQEAALEAAAVIHRGEIDPETGAYKKVAVAPVWSMSQEVLARKAFVDYTGNNINHPNDYFHRIYAQTILDTVIGYENIPSVLAGIQNWSGVATGQPTFYFDQYSIDGELSGHPNPYVSGLVSLNITHGQTVGLRGWIGFNVPISAFGYTLTGNKEDVVWRSTFNYPTEQGIIDLAGVHAQRYHIEADTSTLVAGNTYQIGFYAKLANGDVEPLDTFTVTVASVQIVPFKNRVNGTKYDLGGFTANGNIGYLFPVASWNVASGHEPVGVTTSDSMGLYGWANFSSTPLVRVGYYWDTNTNGISWQPDLGAVTEQAVVDLGGIRFHANAPMSSAPSLGVHTVHYVGQLSDGTIVEFDSWRMNIG